MWMVIHMARTQVLAELIRERLAREGFLVRVRPVYRSAGNRDNYFELRVLQSEADEARQLLLDLGLC